MSLAGILSALRITGGKLGEQTLLFQGAGEAATGIADLAVAAMVAEGPGRSRRRAGVAGCSIRAALSSSSERISPRTSSRMRTTIRRSIRCSRAVNALRPTAIIGVAAVANAFNENIVRAMASLNERPIVFALSNPTSKAECRRSRRIAGPRARDFRVRLAFRSRDDRRSAIRAAPGEQFYIFPASVWG